MRIHYNGAFKELTQKDIDDGLEIRWAGLYKCGPQYMVDRTHKRYFLVYIINGACVYRAPDGSMARLTEGDILLYRPFERQWLKADPSDPVTFLGASFSGHILETLMRTCRLNKMMYRHHGINQDLIRLFENLISAITLNHNNACLVGLLMQLIGEIERNVCCGQKNLPKESDSKNLIKVENYLRSNYNKKLTVNEIALIAGYSVSRFQYLFKKQFGVSAMDYLINVRLQMAKDMLRYDLLPVYEIAYSVGFNDPYYFSKMFKKRAGVSPREYRMKYQIDQ